jgi:hypothetical protein
MLLYLGEMALKLVLYSPRKFWFYAYFFGAEDIAADPRTRRNSIV